MAESKTIETMVDPAGGAIAFEAGAKLIQHAAPKGFAKIKTWWSGKELLLVGQPQSGKTTFANYLELGLFEPERKDPNTTYDVEDRPAVTVSMGRNGALELTVKRLTDTAGQHGPMAHAQVCYDRRPHCIIVMTDFTRPLEHENERLGAATWLRDYCHHLDRLWRAGDRRKNRLKHMILLVNKIDHAQEAKASERVKALSDIISTRLSFARGRMKTAIPVVQCVCVDNEMGTKYIDMAISNIAMGLR